MWNEGKITLMTIETIVVYYIVLPPTYHIETHAPSPYSVHADSKNNETNALDFNKSPTNKTRAIQFEWQICDNSIPKDPL